MLCPDIILMNSRTSGTDVVEAISSSTYRGNIIMLVDSDKCGAEALAAGATDYLLKDITCQELLAGIKQAYQSRPSGEDKDRTETVLQLFIRQPRNDALLTRFVLQLENLLQDNDSSIMHMANHGDYETIITISELPDRIEKVLAAIDNMSSIESLHEEIRPSNGHPTFFSTATTTPKQNTDSNNKRVYLNLKDTTFAPQTLATMLN